VTGDKADITWLGQLWVRMGKHDVRVRLRGASASSNNSEPFVVDQGFRGKTRAKVAEGGAKAGVWCINQTCLCGMGKP
jgi:hypothetical protein